MAREWYEPDGEDEELIGPEEDEDDDEDEDTYPTEYLDPPWWDPLMAVPVYGIDYRTFEDHAQQGRLNRGYMD